MYKVGNLRPKLRKISIVGLCVIALLLAGYAGAWFNERDNNGVISGSLSQQRKIVTRESRLISQIAKEVGPSVVSINVSITDQTTDVFGFSTGRTARAAGTGIIISDKGYIMTNRHVVPNGTTNVNVILSDGTEFKNVSVVGRTSESDSLDVAFLKINDLKGHTLTPAVIGQTSDMQVGDNVVAIGNALGQFQNTVTSGIVSGFGRSVQAGDSSGSASESLVDLIQTDAAINEGNSGGPLVNLNGQVIGINTAIAGGAQNIGFAIPIDAVSPLIDQVVKSGKFSRPYLGVRYIPLTPDVANQLNLKETKGAYVAPATGSDSSSVIPDSPADKAGVKEKDIIIAVDNTKIDQSHSLTSLLSAHKPGDKVRLTIIRDGKTIQLTATLEPLPGDL